VTIDEVESKGDGVTELEVDTLKGIKGKRISINI